MSSQFDDDDDYDDIIKAHLSAPSNCNIVNEYYSGANKKKGIGTSWRNATSK